MADESKRSEDKKLTAHNRVIISMVVSIVLCSFVTLIFLIPLIILINIYSIRGNIFIPIILITTFAAVGLMVFLLYKDMKIITKVELNDHYLCLSNIVSTKKIPFAQIALIKIVEKDIQLTGKLERVAIIRDDYGRKIGQFSSLLNNFDALIKVIEFRVQIVAKSNTEEETEIC